MNYMMQMNNFWVRRRIKRIKSGAADLYFALLEVSNSVGWNLEVSVSNTLLMGMTGLSKSGFMRARQELIDNGYILYHYGSGSQKGIYTLKEFTYDKLFK